MNGGMQLSDPTLQQDVKNTVLILASCLVRRIHLHKNALQEKTYPELCVCVLYLGQCDSEIIFNRICRLRVISRTTAY